MDSQSLMGKLPFGVAKRCAHTRVEAIVGLNTADEKLIDELGISQVVETNPLHLPFEQVKENLKLVGAPYEPEMIGVRRERFPFSSFPQVCYSHAPKVFYSLLRQLDQF